MLSYYDVLGRGLVLMVRHQKAVIADPILGQVTSTPVTLTFVLSYSACIPRPWVTYAENIFLTPIVYE